MFHISQGNRFHISQGHPFFFFLYRASLHQWSYWVAFNIEPTDLLDEWWPMYLRVMSDYDLWWPWTLPWFVWAQGWWPSDDWWWPMMTDEGTVMTDDDLWWLFYLEPYKTHPQQLEPTPKWHTILGGPCTSHTDPHKNFQYPNHTFAPHRSRTRNATRPKRTAPYVLGPNHSRYRHSM